MPSGLSEENSWTNIPIRKKYYEQLKKQAEGERRSVTSYLEKLLIDRGVVKDLGTLN